MVSKREPRSFEKEFVELERNYSSFESTVNEFRQKINWSVMECYSKATLFGLHKYKGKTKNNRKNTW